MADPEVDSLVSYPLMFIVKNAVWSLIPLSQIYLPFDKVPILLTLPIFAFFLHTIVLIFNSIFPVLWRHLICSFNFISNFILSTGIVLMFRFAKRISIPFQFLLSSTFSYSSLSLLALLCLVACLGTWKSSGISGMVVIALPGWGIWLFNPLAGG